MSILAGLGWRDSHQHWLSEKNVEASPARVSAVHGSGLVALGLYPEEPRAPAQVELNARTIETLGAPCVGDWILCQRSGPTWRAIDVAPRSSYFVRKEKGRSSAAQGIAANIDHVFIVTAVGGDLSARRLERYVAQVWASGAEPVIVINKIDREHDARTLLREVEAVAAGVPIVRVSALAEIGLHELSPWLFEANTVALVGSSGVGKSSLVNRLLGEQRLVTQPVRAHDETGTHTTTHRELVHSERGFLLIDTPGMRELGLFDAEHGLEAAFPELVALSQQCRFSDCQHTHEPGCAVREAIARGLVPHARLASYRALQDELARNQSRSAERVAHDKQRWKTIHRAQREKRKLHAKFGLKE